MFDMHRETLENAIRAVHKRDYWSAYPEAPSGKIYGETAREDGQAAFKARLNGLFAIDQPGSVGAIGGERSPYGIDLNITYPKSDLDVLVNAAQAAMQDWKNASIEMRTGVCMEILHRLNQRSFEMAFAVMHTTGQGFMMAFQAGGPHAQDRGLEAVTYAWEEMTRTPQHVTWTKRVSKTDSVSLAKTYRIVPRGVAVVIGCSTFPTWNSYPGLFASLATGNAVVIKPHPGAVLPLAITVEVAREVIGEAGFDPNLVTLAVDTHEAPIAQELVSHAAVGIVDYTGGSAFGNWVEENAKQAIVFTEKAGVNSVIVDSVDDLRAVTGNLGFTLCLYSGQMCTTSQNFYIPREGIETGEGHRSFDDVAQALGKAIDWLLSDPKRGAEVLGAVQNETTIERVSEAVARASEIIRAGSSIENEMFPGARTMSPTLIKVDATDEAQYMQEVFGPVAFVIATDSTEQSIELASRSAREHGAITWAAYSTNPSVLERIEDAAADCGAALSCNLTGMIWVNQSAAFGDFHVSGANPAGNATLCDGAFVSPRFRIVQSRVPVAAPEPVGA